VTQPVFTRCPKCASDGRDNHRDNLAVYPDGHVYCFACKYYRSGPKEPLQVMAQRVLDSNEATVVREGENKKVILPEDCTHTLPSEAAEWLVDCGLTPEQIIAHEIQWSQHWYRIIFPIRINGELVAWIGRAVHGNHLPKWFKSGLFKGVLYRLGDGNPNADSNVLVIVEDIVSAIRVSKYYHTTPLFGVTLTPGLPRAIAYQYDAVVFWLDDGATRAALDGCSEMIGHGVQAFCVWTPIDPKDYSDEAIKNKLADASASFRASRMASDAKESIRGTYIDNELYGDYGG